MQLNPLPFTPQVAKPTALATPAAQAAVVTAALTSQPAAQISRTQTVYASQATGKTDHARTAQSGTDTGDSRDTRAGAVNARTNGAGYRGRGSVLDLSV